MTFLCKTSKLKYKISLSDVFIYDYPVLLPESWNLDLFSPESPYLNLDIKLLEKVGLDTELDTGIYIRVMTDCFDPDTGRGS